MDSQPSVLVVCRELMERQPDMLTLRQNDVEDALLCGCDLLMAARGTPVIGNIQQQLVSHQHEVNGGERSRQSNYRCREMSGAHRPGGAMATTWSVLREGERKACVRESSSQQCNTTAQSSN